MSHDTLASTDQATASMEQALRELRDVHSALAEGLLPWVTSPLSARYLAQGNRVIEAFKTQSGDSATELRTAVESYCQVCLDFLKLQGRFLKTGRYHQTDVKAVIANVYDNPDVMNRYYLDGLFLTFAFWPNHQALLQFFRQQFLVKLQHAKQIVEVGVGHGLFFLEAAQALPNTQLTGLDISPYSLAYTERLLRAHGYDAQRFTLQQQDICAVADAELVQADAVVCGEVLEHVHDPQQLLRRIARCLRPGGTAFFTTCANAEAVDHIFLFRDVQHIHEVLAAGGFMVCDEIALTIPGMEQQVPLPLNYACVARVEGA